MSHFPRNVKIALIPNGQQDGKVDVPFVGKKNFFKTHSDFCGHFRGGEF